jgi:phosphatidylethanolamine N-methyltransferase
MAPGANTVSVVAGSNQCHDDFRFWSERQAERICTVIKQAFDVEYVPEVIVADANLSALANRILLSKHVLTA